MGGSHQIKRDCIFFNAAVIFGILLSCMGSVGPYRQGDIDKLNKIQRAAARFVTIKQPPV